MDGGEETASRGSASSCVVSRTFIAVVTSLGLGRALSLGRGCPAMVLHVWREGLFCTIRFSAYNRIFS